MNVLVTGATGFLGKSLCSNLETQGHRVLRVNSRNCDLRREDSLNVVARGKYDRIFHLAVWTRAGDFCRLHQGEQWIINQQINTNVLKWWKEMQPQAAMIAIGTTAAYSPDEEQIEENYLKSEPLPSLAAYAMSKRMLYTGLMSLHLEYGLKYLHVIPPVLYGPDYHVDRPELHFVYDLIRKIGRGKCYGEKVNLWGDGSQRREVVLVADFLRAMNVLLDRTSNASVNIGSGEAHAIRHFAELISKFVGYDSDQICYDASKSAGPKSKCLNVSRLRLLVPEFEPTPLLQGLKETVAWSMKHLLELRQES